MVQMKQRFQPDVCSGLTDNFFITVSTLLADAAGPDFRLMPCLLGCWLAGSTLR
jgi:hypothetical protein